MSGISTLKALGLALAVGLLLPLVTSARADEEPRAVMQARELLGPPRGQPLAGAALEAATRTIASLLRCPVCQGLAVADSPATMAVEMRDQVRELAAVGYDEEQVLTYFERSYGEFVRLRPPLRGVNWIVWVAPLLALGAGVVLVRRYVWRRVSFGPAGIDASVPSAASPAGSDPAAIVAPSADALPDDPELARCVLRVRELAYGWPGGVRPTAATGPEQAAHS